MSSKIILAIVLCFTASVGVVALLFGMSGILKDKRNSFLREFPPHPITEGDTLNLRYNSYYIAGGTPHTLYLGNAKAPLHLLQVNLTTLDTIHVRLNVKGIMDQKFWSVKVQVDSPYYYVLDGAVPVIFKGSVQDWKAQRYLSDSLYFLDFVPIGAGSFAVKSLSGSTGENILGKLTAWPPYRTFTDQVLQKQLDGVFCTDGTLRYNREHHQLVYFHYYKNEFIVLDTSLSLIYRGHSIDTISQVKIETATIEAENTMTLTSPPFFVNKRSDTAGDWLFINSNLLARNEYPEAFDQGNVIDLYDLQQGKYSFSFYIYKYRNQYDMREFRVLGGRLVALFENTLIVYYLKPEYFSKREL